jgi:signal peptidase I
VLYFLIDTVVARVRVENISMLPTLRPGEFILVNKLTYRFNESERGDIVIFHFPQNPREDYIKRVIGLPGDVVEIAENQVYVNGFKLHEPYLTSPMIYDGTWTVPEDALFVLGDNRNQSSDSHSWGYVPLENVVGKAIVVYWPLTDLKVLSQQNVVYAANGT